MKIAFFFPAKILVAEAPTSWIFTAIPGTPYFTIDHYPFFDTVKGRIASKALSEVQTYLLIEIEPGILAPITATGDAAALIERHVESLAASLPKWRSYLANPASYEAEQTVKREAAKAYNARRDAETAERKARIDAEHEAAYQASLSTFAAGEQISLEHFERACKEYEVKMPIKTLGWARKHVSAVGRKSATLAGAAKHNSPHFWSAVRELFDNLSENKRLTD